MSTVPTALAVGQKETEKEAVRCPQCRLVQYRLPSNQCRRCGTVLVRTASIPRSRKLRSSSSNFDCLPNVSRRLRAWRGFRGWKQEKLAERAGTSRSYISRFEKGRVIDPHIRTLERLAEALDITLVQFLFVPVGETNLGYHPTDVGDCIRRWRQTKDLSQNGLAGLVWPERKTHHRHWLSGVENHHRFPLLCTLQIIANGLGITLQGLLAGPPKES